MASPCTNNPNEVISAVVGIQTAEENFERELDDAADAATENADKFNAFVNGSDTQTVQLGEGSPTPTIRNTVRQMMSAAATLDSADVSGKSTTANGGSEMRTLAERFGDVVNVKDYGAKGDGVTDDSGAFSAAIEAAGGRSVFVPDGSYVVGSSYQNANIVCFSDNVTFSKKEVDIQNVSLPFDYEKLKSRRRLVARLDTPSMFAGSIFSSYTWQSFEITDNYIFVCMAAVKAADSLSYGYVCIYDIFGVYLTSFCTGVLSSSKPYNQMLSVFESSSSITVYTVKASSDTDESNYPAKYVLSKDSMPEEGVVVEPVKSYTSITLSYNGFVANDRIVVCNNKTPFSIINDYSYFKKFDFDENLLGYLKIFWDGTGYGSAVPKVQSITSDGGIVACGLGAYTNDTAETVSNSQYQGVKILNSNGEKVFSVVFEPLKLINKYKQAFNDNNISVVENEGVSLHDGRIYTFTRLKTTSNVENTIAVIEEFSRSPMAIDCSDCLAVELYPSPASTQMHYVPFIEGKRINPYTGSELVGVADVLDMMVRYDMKEVSVYTGSTPFKKLDNTTNYGYYMLLQFFKGTNNTIYSITHGNTETSGNSSFARYSGGVGSWSAEGMDVKSINMQLGAVSASNSYGRIYGYAFADGSLTQLFRWYDSSSSDAFVQIGDGATVKSVHLLVSGMNYMAKGTAFYPNTTNTASLGTSNKVWSNLYASTGPWADSDARLKDNIEQTPETLLKAWGNVRIKVFQFKDAIAKKGESARIHLGVIAQEVMSSFAAEGLDASRYGLFGYDEWDDEYETVEIVDSEERRDEDGNIVQERQAHLEKRLVARAGNKYSIRYEEALALECAYQRWLGEKRDTRIAALEARLNEISGNGTAPSGASPDNI